MDQVFLKLNKTKTEFIYSGWPSQLGNCIATTIDVNGETITTANVTKYLGAHLNSALNFKQHIKTKCEAAMFNLQCILGGLPKCSIEHFQRVQNIAAKIVLGKGKYDNTTRCLAELHWLPIQQRIEFKIITLVHKSLHGLVPQCLVDLLTRKVLRREGLHSNNRTSQF